MQAVLSVQIIAEYMWSRSDTDKQLLWIVKKTQLSHRFLNYCSSQLANTV